MLVITFGFIDLPDINLRVFWFQHIGFSFILKPSGTTGLTDFRTDLTSFGVSLTFFFKTISLIVHFLVSVEVIDVISTFLLI
jgi:hypothetical protein